MNSHVSQQDAAKELIRRRAARQSLFNFTSYVFPEFNDSWHVRVLCDVLDRWVAKEIINLMIFLPPRHGKSLLVSEHLPAYILGRKPDAHLISASYTASLASSFNRKVQRIIDTPTYANLFPETQLYGKNVRTAAHGAWLRNDSVFEVVGHNGSYRNAGVGGALVGHGYDYGSIDDMIKSRGEANSPTYRNRSFDWLRGVFLTRREKNASTLITFTRWHQDDAVGRMLDLANSDDSVAQWHVVRFPAIAEEPLDPLDQRQIGEPLWAWKYDLKALEEARATYGEFEWASQYQQRPQPIGAGLFDTEQITKIVDTIPEYTQAVRFYDLAVSEKKTADYTAGVKMAMLADNTPAILDVYRKQSNPVDTFEAIIHNALIDGADVRIVLEAENSARVQLGFLLRDKRLHNHNVSIQQPKGDKYTRATPFAARVNAGVVTLVRAGWNRAYLDEMAMFPQGAHDDQVDATSGAWEALNKVNTWEARLA